MISVDTIKTVKKIFHSYDLDESGLLSSKELNRFFRSMETYFTNRELSEAMYLIDYNNDGQVSCNEFIQYMLEDN